MTASPNMATITASLERSLQNCSLNHERRRRSNRGGGGEAEEGITERRRSSTSEDNNNLPNTVSDTSLELNSHLSLPYHWEQCLDLKTGEIYYMNWRNGMKASEDPRVSAEYGGDFYSEEENDDDDSSYNSEESSSESSPCSSRERAHYNNSNSNSNSNSNNNNNNNNSNSNNHQHRVEKDKSNVLVVAGCKSCLMYFMVPKQVEDCPKCTGQLLHFDRSESSSP